MKVLLDTHMFIWWDSDPARLTQSARDVCEDPTNELTLSVVSVWESQIKSQLGKLPLRVPLYELIASQQDMNHIAVLPVELSHVLALERLPAHHRDPFDRLNIAQALSTGASICTADPMLQAYSAALLR